MDQHPGGASRADQLREELLDIESQIQQVEREYLALGRELVTDAAFTREELQQIADELHEKRDLIISSIDNLRTRNKQEYGGYDQMHRPAHSPIYSEEMDPNGGYRYPNYADEAMGAGGYDDVDRLVDRDLHDLRNSDGMQILEDYARMTGGVLPPLDGLPSDSIETTPSMAESLLGHGIAVEPRRSAPVPARNIAPEEEKEDVQVQVQEPAGAEKENESGNGSSGSEADALKKELAAKEKLLADNDKEKKKLQDEVEKLKKDVQKKETPPAPAIRFAGMAMGGWVRGAVVESDEWDAARIAVLRAEVEALRVELGQSLVEGKQAAGTGTLASKWEALQAKERLLKMLETAGNAGVGAGAAATTEAEPWDARVTHQRWEWKGRPVMIKHIVKCTPAA